MSSNADKLMRCVWDGKAFAPVGIPAQQWCRETLDENENVAVDVSRVRSKQSHNHQFAEIIGLWTTLPETMHDLPYAKSADALRKHALIACGYCDTEVIAADDTEAAWKIAAMSKRWTEAAYGYSVVDVTGSVVTVYTPHSQSYRAMGKKTFQESKDAVLQWISHKMGIEDVRPN